MKNQDYEKTRTALRYWLQGKEYFEALRAVEFAMRYHTGLRKDGVSPEFQHQVSQANYARTLSGLMFPEPTITTIILHDTVEDHPVSRETIREMFGREIELSVELMTNQYPDGTKKPKDAYYAAQAENAIASIAKGVDRIHNHQTMVGVFTPEKQIRYIKETTDFILPMLKVARRRFPQQEAAYLNIATVLKIQIEMIEAMHGGNVG